MRKWLREWLLGGDIQRPDPIPITVRVEYPDMPVRLNEPIKLTEDQFLRLVAAMNAPDLLLAKQIRRADAIEMRITRLDESATGSLYSMESRHRALELQVGLLRDDVTVLKGKIKGTEIQETLRKV